MAVTKVPGRGWHSSECDKYFDSEEAAVHYDQREQMKRSKPADSVLDTLTTEELGRFERIYGSLLRHC
jgi:hypothetical protein